MPALNVMLFDDAVDASCFGIAWELKVEPPIISASTLEAGFLCWNPAACAARLTKNDARSVLKASFTESDSLGVGP